MIPPFSSEKFSNHTIGALLFTFIVVVPSYSLIPCETIESLNLYFLLKFSILAFLVGFMCNLLFENSTRTSAFIVSFGFLFIVAARILYEVFLGTSVHSSWLDELLVSTILVLPFSFLGAALSFRLKKS